MIMFLAVKYGAVYGFHHSFLGYFRPPSSPPNTMMTSFMYKMIAKMFEVPLKGKWHNGVPNN